MPPSGICYQPNKAFCELLGSFLTPSIAQCSCAAPKESLAAGNVAIAPPGHFQCNEQSSGQVKAQPETRGELIAKLNPQHTELRLSKNWDDPPRFHPGLFYLFLGFCAPLSCFFHDFPHWWETNYECLKCQSFPEIWIVVSWPVQLWFNVLCTVQPFPSAQQKQGFELSSTWDTHLKLI